MATNIFNILDGNASKNSLIPDRDVNAITGSIFIQNNMKLNGAPREANILKECLSGNIPDFLRNFSTVTVTDTTNTIIYLAMSDYICIGSDEDYVRVPMNPHTAQEIANKYDCTLPTRKMVHDIWRNSINKLPPLPWGPPFDNSMQSTERIGIHSSRIQKQLDGKDFKALTSGHKKDVVLTNRLSPNNPKKKVAIYGWTQVNGQPIQGLNPSDHDDMYADYSHGIRLIARDVMINGNPDRIENIFKDAKLSALISDEGILTFPKY